MLPVAWSICVDAGGEHAGAISGAMNMAGQVGSLISSVAFGYWVEWSGSYDRALMPLAAMLIVSGCVFATIDPAKKMIPDHAPEPVQTELNGFERAIDILIGVGRRDIPASVGKHQHALVQQTQGKVAIQANSCARRVSR